MTGTSNACAPAVSDPQDMRVVVHTLGFDGAHRVICLLRQRYYTVRSFSAHVVNDADAWTFTCIVRFDRQPDVLLARLNRLPSVIDARFA